MGPGTIYAEAAAKRLSSTTRYGKYDDRKLPNYQEGAFHDYEIYRMSNDVLHRVDFKQRHGFIEMSGWGPDFVKTR